MGSPGVSQGRLPFLRGQGLGFTDKAGLEVFGGRPLSLFPHANVLANNPAVGLDSPRAPMSPVASS
jgi:hypothetical protein